MLPPSELGSKPYGGTLGTLRDFCLEEFQCNVFFETGMGRGDSLTYALSYKFERLFSVEVDLQTFLWNGVPLRLRWFYRDLTLVYGPSVHALERCLPKLKKTDRVLYFLDADMAYLCQVVTMPPAFLPSMFSCG